MTNNKNKSVKPTSSSAIKTLSTPVKKKSIKKVVIKSEVKKVDARIRTRKQRASDLFKLIMDGPTFQVHKDMFVESLFRQDFGKYVACEINRFYREWAVKNLVKDLKILIAELQ